MRFIVFLSFFTLIVSSCQKAGLGGNSDITVNVTVDTLGNLCTLCDVYIFYGDSSFNSLEKNLYDDAGVTNIYGQYTFSNLNRGEYSLYVEGTNTLNDEEVRGRSGAAVENIKTQYFVPINAR